MKVFSKKKYLKRCRELGISTHDDVHWPDDCDGMPVTGNRCTGSNGVTYVMEDNWCIDVPNPTVSDIIDIVKEEKKMYTMKDFIEKPIAVRVGQDHKEEFLKMCEAEGLRWMSGVKATEFTPKWLGEDLCIAYNIPHFPKGLGWESGHQYSLHNITVVDFKDFTAKPEPRYQIIIDCDGKTTTAKMMVDGKEVKTGVAKYNPADKFDFSIGAKTAFDRLWGKEPEPVKPTSAFKVGDRVKCVKVADGNKKVVGKYGTLVKVTDDTRLPILVDFDEDIGGSSNNDLRGVKPGCGWWCPKGALELVTVREVKRPAKPGEYIKIVNPCGLAIDEYREGDILKVVKVNDKYGWAYYKDAVAKYANVTEYVVLEGYVPPMEPVKSEAKFKVGDRVVCTASIAYSNRPKGKRGTVRGFSGDGWVQVEFDVDVGGHSLDGKCKDGHGLVCPFDKLKVEQYKEVKRHAKVGEWVKIVKAKGNPTERYKTGDILMVKKEWMNGSGCVHLTCDGAHACPDEYVVLEGYKG